MNASLGHPGPTPGFFTYRFLVRRLVLMSRED